ncbi:voltage-gated potassium channel [Pholiota conissans]|uniref:Voltage-gated potassium channel n=1 Tax=Pholiota conissans TaxID=109636 RepID=A0A9P5YW27_9AGAR|nr:voltage-gated potassium channel [Pholiota conissans]
MNDPGLEDVILDSAQAVRQSLEAGDKASVTPLNSTSHASTKAGLQPHEDDTHPQPQHRHSRHRHKRGDQTKRDEEDASLYQPTLWWFTSTAFPLFAGTFGPIANLLSICALVEPWRVHTDDGSKIPDPHWLTGLNATSLFLALVANLVLMFNFAHRISYALAQPITISLWYISSILLIICVCLVHTLDPQPHLAIRQLAYSQSYYYGIISSALYFAVSTLLLLSSLGSVVFHAYSPSFSALTGPQRTLMLQTTTFSLYLAIGAGVFAEIEDWAFTDGIYWADYTVLTIGLGSDFPLTTVLGRMLLIPYAAFGITLIGLVVSSVRGLVLERAKAKVARRHLKKEREKWSNNINERLRAASSMAGRTLTQESTMSSSHSHTTYRQRWKEYRLMRLPRQLVKHAKVPLKHEDQKGAWHRAEFELMRLIQIRSESREPYEALFISFLIILVVWVGGTLIFWSCEHKIQGWSFPDAFYFSYTSLLTIGYGDFYPSSSAGKPFFVVWSLISVPAMTVFISNMGDTVVKWLKEVTIWISQWTILPEKKVDHVDEKYAKRTGEQRQAREVSKSVSSKDSNSADLESQTNHLSSGTANHQPRLRKLKTGPHNPDHPVRRKSAALKDDVEHLGDKVEDFEKSEGRSGSLAARLSREISRLAKDLRQKPPKMYTWDEWSVWLEMLGEKDEEETSLATAGQRHSRTDVPVQILTVAPSVGLPERPKSAPPEPEIPGAYDGGAIPNAVHLEHRISAASTHPWVYHDERNVLDQSYAHSAQNDDTDWRWTWLGDQGPLFSRLTETEWIIEKLCFRLEEVLEDEIREAHSLAYERNRTSSGH